ncbi:MAG TPA: DinB family protein [Gemmatimonadales bacterium]|jgi:uncharacterized damage-inducible protein DinB
MSEIDRIADELTRDQQGEPWHGPSARQVLGGVTASAAAARPIAGGHSIWELVLHIIAWRNEVARRVEGGEPAEPAEGDWPPVAETTDAAWARTLTRLEGSHRGLTAALGKLAEARLDERVGQRDRSVGSGVTYYVTLHGVAQHDAYHLGQVSVLKRALGLL